MGPTLYVGLLFSSPLVPDPGSEGDVVVGVILAVGCGLSCGGSVVRFRAIAGFLSFRVVEDEQPHAKPIPQFRMAGVSDPPPHAAVLRSQDVTADIPALLKP